MATEANLKLNMPFDEADGSAVAYDYSSERNDATVTKASFISGRQGNCIHFAGTGKAEITNDVIPLAGTFTIIAWVKPALLEDGIAKQIGLFCNTDELEGYRDLWVTSEAGSWGFYAIRKSGNTVTLFRDTQELGTIALPGTLTGISLLQDIYGSEYAYADLDEVKVYNLALTTEEIAEELKTVSMLEYYLDGVNLKDYGIVVEGSSGVTDLPKLKSPTSSDWADYHGKVIDLSDKRFEEREISLSCWIKASGKMDFAERLNRLYEVLRKDGTNRLMIAIHPTKPLLYEVYCEDGVALSKKWHDDKMIGTFTLKLQEPDPVKRVVRHQRNGASTAQLTIGFRSDKMVNIYWGDGEVDTDVYGDHTGDNAITHNYASNGTFYAVVAGVIEEIEDFETNGIVVWNRL